MPTPDFCQKLELCYRQNRFLSLALAKTVTKLTFPFQYTCRWIAGPRELGYGGCLCQCSISEKRHYDHYCSCKAKHLIGGWLTGQRFSPFLSWREAWWSKHTHMWCWTGAERVLCLDSQAAGRKRDIVGLTWVSETSRPHLLIVLLLVLLPLSLWGPFSIYHSGQELEW